MYCIPSHSAANTHQILEPQCELSLGHFPYSVTFLTGQLFIALLPGVILPSYISPGHLANLICSEAGGIFTQLCRPLQSW